MSDVVLSTNVFDFCFVFHLVLYFCSTYVILPIHYVQNVARLIALHILYVCIFTST